MALDRQWHEQHPMPANASLDQRVAWHVEHAAHCGCRKIPAGILKELERREIPLPVVAPSKIPPAG